MNDSTVIFISKDNTSVKHYKISKTKIIVSVALFLFIFLTTGKYVLDVLVDFSQNSKIERLKNNNQFLKNQLSIVSKKVETIQSQLNDIEKRDDEIRMIMGVEKLNDDLRDVGIGGANFEYRLTDIQLDSDVENNLTSQVELISKLEREVKLELQSYNELINTYYAKEDSLRHLPALHPVLQGRVTSSFGMRLHPILKSRKRHGGIDLSAKTGTPIYAAADGIVKLAKYNGGYGRCVFIDHVYGYETRYGHMKEYFVRTGQKVKRGDKIGLVGKTGLATAPHLHFEVLLNGKEMNPMHYYFDDPELNRLVINRQ